MEQVVECDRYIDLVPTDGQHAPLRPATVREWLSVDWDGPKQELVALLSLMTGLNGREVRHLAKSWIFEDDGEIFVHVPERARCVIYADHPCHFCQTGYDGHFSSQYRSRRIPIYDDRLAAVLDASDPPDGHLTPNSVTQVMQYMKDQSPIVRGISSVALRHTCGVALGAKGYEREEIRRWFGKSLDVEYGNMTASKNYQTIAAISPWDEFEALGTGEFRP